MSLFRVDIYIIIVNANFEKTGIFIWSSCIYYHIDYGHLQTTLQLHNSKKDYLSYILDIYMHQFAVLQAD